ncbi:MAG: class I SAM-dependent RNA methyltransferase [Hyphomicrobiaceae bacterium]
MGDEPTRTEQHAITVTIERLAALGHGVGPGPGGRPVYVPFALPGEVWRVPAAGGTSSPDGRGSLAVPADPIEIGERRPPQCSHYGACGGCNLQHVPRPLYANWKRSRILDALAGEGIAATVADCVPGPMQSRRRAVFTARRDRGPVTLGFFEQRTNSVVALEDCAILVPAIASRLGDLGRIAAVICPSRGDLRLTVLQTTTGLDVSVDGVGRDPERAERKTLAEIALGAGIVRLVVDGYDVVRSGQPELQIDGVAIVPPSRVFVQASAAAEAEMIAHVRAAAKGAKFAADLFCGIGTFAVALARTMRVSAYDADASATAALETALRHAQGRKPVTAHVRDLFREPLSRKELERFDVVVFDPPRAGAKAQAEMLAKSLVPRIIAVACDAASFARDCRILVDGGYEIEQIQPIDQFVDSTHVEMVAVLARPSSVSRARRRR